MRAIVTGAAGFIGSHLVDRLLEEGNKVIGIDNLLTGNNLNLENAMLNKDFEFILHDVSKDMNENLSNINFIFHAASPASPPKYFEFPYQTMEVNTLGTYKMLKLAEQNRSRFIFFSTSEIYGDPQVHPQVEEYWGNVNPIGPRSIYDEAKRFGETITSQFVRDLRVNSSIIRIFNTYGPRPDPYDGRVVSTLLRQAIKNEDFTVNGDGNQTRSFCFIDDLVDGIMKMSKSNEIGPINLGNPFEITINELVELISKITKTTNKIKLNPAMTDDPNKRKPDISKAKQNLGWEPKIILEHGLEITYNYMRNQLLNE
jgi:dTDP-glucose 4,6-dehydratase